MPKDPPATDTVQNLPGEDGNQKGGESYRESNNGGLSDEDRIKNVVIIAKSMLGGRMRSKGKSDKWRGQDLLMYVYWNEDSPEASRMALASLNQTMFPDPDGGLTSNPYSRTLPHKDGFMNNLFGDKKIIQSMVIRQYDSSKDYSARYEDWAVRSGVPVFVDINQRPHNTTLRSEEY